jgi:hypothetical protein
MGASVTLTAPSIGVAPGGEATLELRLRNTGTVVDEFALGVLGDAAGWSSVEPPTISLFPGAEETARIIFRPPRSPQVPAGPMPFGLHARSREDAAGSTVEEGIVEVGPFLEPFAELIPRTSRGSRSASHDLALDNRGNIRLNAEVEAADADRLLGFDVKPPGIVVEPGMAGFAKVRVKPAKLFWRGTPKTRPFQLVVRPEGGMPVTLDGALLQEAVLPSWTMRALLALLALLILAVILWLGVLKPSIESAASDAVASPLAELRDDVNTALDDAGLPTMGPDGAPDGESPSPGPSASAGSSGPPPSPPGPFIPGLGNPIDGRLLLGQEAFVPTGTLFVTDLVFSNPNGRTGAIILRREGDDGTDITMIELDLENFRDLDFHFVTPIVVTSGRRLSMDLRCTSAGECNPAILWSGYLKP